MSCEGRGHRTGPKVTSVTEMVADAFERGRQAERARLIPAPHEIEHPLEWQQGYYSGVLVSHPEAVRTAWERIADRLQARAQECYALYEANRTVDGWKNYARKQHYLSTELSNEASKCRALAKGGEGEAE